MMAQSAKRTVTAGLAGGASSGRVNLLLTYDAVTRSAPLLGPLADSSNFRRNIA
jgi:hypothetical protein